jgi:uncharacterized Zn finger protein (UPF0148 family)
MITIGHYQVQTRRKYGRVRCPYCGAMSHVVKEHDHGFQVRECHNSHIFTYDYTQEGIYQVYANYKMV